MKFFVCGFFCAVLLAGSGMADETIPPAFPGKQPGKASASVRNGEMVLSNAVIRARWKIDRGTFRFVSAMDRLGGGTARGSIPFTVDIGNGAIVSADRMIVTEGPRLEPLSPVPDAPVYSRRIGGKSITISLEDRETGLRVVWRGILRDGSHYIQQQLAFTTLKPDLRLADITLLDVRTPGMKAMVSGEVQGSPAVTGTLFFGIEHPLAVSSVSGADNPEIICRFGQGIGLGPGKNFTLSSVIGVVPTGQMRRGFLCYLERERAHPYRPYIHYNSWYDLNIDRPGNRMTDAEALASIRAIGDELCKKRGAKLDGFVMDDGWDSHERVWDFHEEFPQGFANIREAARAYGAGIGVWMSPWGGYGTPKEERIENGKKAGFETNSQGFSMAGEKYGAHFRTVAARMMRTYGVNYFKFDGMGGGAFTAGVQKELSGDIEAILETVDGLRAINPDLFINATVGTWPSPFWTRYADSIWRQGDDTAFAGVGNNREQWITYRDKFTYERIVRKGPLYPLNSLMFHGLVIGSRGGPGEMPKEELSVRHEIRTAFGCGSDLQELYITPNLLTAQMWDDLAESARWYRGNTAVLADTHWVGGNPGSLEIYGWAAWSPKKAALTLRNPDAQPHDFKLDVAQAFELPQNAPISYTLKSPYKDQRIQEIKAQGGKAEIIRLESFEVLTFDALPLIPSPAKR